MVESEFGVRNVHPWTQGARSESNRAPLVLGNIRDSYRAVDTSAAIL